MWKRSAANALAWLNGSPECCMFSRKRSRYKPHTSHLSVRGDLKEYLTVNAVESLVIEASPFDTENTIQPVLCWLLTIKAAVTRTFPRLLGPQPQLHCGTMANIIFQPNKVF